MGTGPTIEAVEGGGGDLGGANNAATAFNGNVTKAIGDITAKLNEAQAKITELNNQLAAADRKIMALQNAKPSSYGSSRAKMGYDDNGNEREPMPVPWEG